uniref:protein-L-isoaspartate(D-aspartate) O-methyltransferase n=1 Tax=Ditylenchus dipsaci TaxID=166011 RepID=A0A915CL82_9BILA
MAKFLGYNAQNGTAQLKYPGLGCGFWIWIFVFTFAKLLGQNGKVAGIDHMPELVKMSEKNIRLNDADLLDSGKLKLITGDGRLGFPSWGLMMLFMLVLQLVTCPKISLIEQ